jgi:hypothetical protein
VLASDLCHCADVAMLKTWSLKKHDDKGVTNGGETANQETEEVQGEMVPDDQAIQWRRGCVRGEGDIPFAELRATDVAKRRQKKLVLSTSVRRLASFDSSGARAWDLSLQKWGPGADQK